MKTVFASEAAMCVAFIAALPEGWTAYPETAGFDIVLVRDVDGVQIGVEAKKSLNAKVLVQVMESDCIFGQGVGPDFRAALVPAGAAGYDMKAIAQRLGITVIEVKSAEDVESEATIDQRLYGIRNYRREVAPFKPELPDLKNQYRGERTWIDFCPPKRCALPDYVPDVTAGSAAPVQLSDWKIKAIKICILLERRGTVSMTDFKHIKIDRTRWLGMGWLGLGESRGVYVVGAHPLDLRKQHPVNFAQIEADFDRWKPVTTSEGIPA